MPACDEPGITYIAAMSRRYLDLEITPELLLRAYASGIFPMADSAEDPDLFWVEPEERGIIPLDGLIVSRSLAKIVRKDTFTVRTDADFDAIIAACAAPSERRERTWINGRIVELFGELHRRGQAHCMSCHDAQGRLVGGLYGLALGAAFFGESMFHRARDASKVALVHLVARLRFGGFSLLDTQFVTEHLATLGAVEVSRRAYRRVLDQAVRRNADFAAWPSDRPMPGAEALRLATQPSLQN
jgi:leucyl/phenylalanyl-tRNA--protein transferase